MAIYIYKLSDDERMELFKSENPTCHAYEIHQPDMEDYLLVFVDYGLAARNIVKVKKSWFEPSGTGTRPDFNDIEIIDHGGTIRLGEYEASVDKLLYDHIEEYRHKTFINDIKSLFNRVNGNSNLDFMYHQLINEFMKIEKENEK